MTTAQRISSKMNLETFAGQQAAMNECRELAVRIEATNCVQRTFYFYDGSSLSFND